SADKLYHSFSDCLTDVSTDDLDDFPDYSAQSTRGKVLTVGSDGSLGWQTPAGGGAAIDDTAGDGDTDVTWSADKLSGLQGKPAAVAKNLSVADWANNTLTVSVTGVTASSLVQVTPAPDSISAWTQCGVYCHSQTNGTLTFKCADQPDVLLTANIVIWG
ncbi:MAG: hypothetical protein IJL87_06755, partial [Clostridia bacterium]|nr:hypothetical protein [Clostridia bacterium]